jgi:hypothetical protein
LRPLRSPSKYTSVRVPRRSIARTIVPAGTFTNSFASRSGPAHNPVSRAVCNQGEGPSPLLTVPRIEDVSERVGTAVGASGTLVGVTGSRVGFDGAAGVAVGAGGRGVGVAMLAASAGAASIAGAAEGAVGTETYAVTNARASPTATVPQCRTRTRHLVVIARRRVEQRPA